MSQDICDDAGTDVTMRLKKLIEANQSLADMESLEEILPKLMDIAKEVTNAEGSSLLLYNPKRKVLEFASVADEVLGEEGVKTLKRTIELKMGEGIAGWVAENRQPLIIKDVQNDPRFFKKADDKTGFHTRNLLCVPMVYNDELLGVISVLNSKNKECFDTECQELLGSFAHLAAVAIIRSRLIETRLKQQRFQIQLEAASKIQSLFWPKLPELPSGSHVWGVSIPAAFVGGDLYDVIPLHDGSWLVYVADVSDKGLPAALVMAALWTKIRSEALLQGEVHQLLKTVNTAMYDLMSEEGFFATIVIGRYWPETGRMELARGGHLPPLWIIGEKLGNMPDLSGPSLGVHPEAVYEKKEIVLLPGESVLFLTDGVHEAENEWVELFGFERLIDHISNAKGPPWGEGILELLSVWQKNATASDDLTMLEIWRDLT